MAIANFGPRKGEFIPDNEAVEYFQQYGKEGFQSGLGWGDLWSRGTPEQEAAEEQRKVAAEQEEIRQAAIEDPGSNVGLLREFSTSPWSSFNQQRAFGQSDLALPGISTANQDRARDEQTRVIQALQAQALGSFNTQAQQQLQQGFQQAGGQQRALGASMRGTGGGAGLRSGFMGAQDVQRGLAGQREMLKLQEQQAAQSALAQMLPQQHAQDVGLAGLSADNSLRNRQLNQDMARFYGDQYLNSILQDEQFRSGLERARLGFDLDAQDLEARRRDQALNGAAAGVGALERVARSNNNSNQPSTSSSGFRQIDGKDSIVPIDDK